MSIFAGPEVQSSDLILSLDAANSKSQPHPPQMKLQGRASAEER